MFEDKAWKRLFGHTTARNDTNPIDEPVVNNELPKANTTRSKTAKKTLITFTGPFHTFSISLGVHSRVFAISTIVFLALFFVFGTISLSYAVFNIMELNNITDSIKLAYLTTMGENESLKTLLKAQEDEKKRQEKLEELTAENAQASKDIIIEFDKISPEQKTYMFKAIPNGAPIKYSDISSEFGSRNHPILGKSSFHEGIDLRADTGTGVNATADGIVNFAASYAGYGNMLIIEHAFGFKTVYAHLSKILVQQGDFIAKGQLVAKSGSSGMSSGPHLHYEVRFLDRAINPHNFLVWNYQKFTDIFTKERSIKWGYLIEVTKWPQLQQMPQASLPLEQKLQAKSTSK
jgi:murein DD-endopeptidase MepM/ murein hydrolase activator NlpD